jgi:hypothetical protein
MSKLARLLVPGARDPLKKIGLSGEKLGKGEGGEGGNCEGSRPRVLIKRT